MQKTGLASVEVVEGDGSRGYEKKAPLPPAGKHGFREEELE